MCESSSEDEVTGAWQLKKSLSSVSQRPEKVSMIERGHLSLPQTTSAALVTSQHLPCNSFGMFSHIYYSELQQQQQQSLLLRRQSSLQQQSKSTGPHLAATGKVEAGDDSDSSDEDMSSRARMVR